MTTPVDVDETTLRLQLAEVGQHAVERGLVLASGGNLSARLPGSQRFVITGAMTWLDQLEAHDFAMMTLDGEVIDGTTEPSSEWKLHQRTYQSRPDVNVVVHLHPQYSVLLDALGYPIRTLTLDHISYVGEVGRVPFYPNGSDELADSAAKAAVDHDCVILAHHGCSVVGDTVSMAYRRALNLEEAATATYRALTLGDTSTSFPGDAMPAQHT